MCLSHIGGDMFVTSPEAWFPILRILNTERERELPTNELSARVPLLATRKMRRRLTFTRAYIAVVDGALEQRTSARNATGKKCFHFRQLPQLLFPYSNTRTVILTRFCIWGKKANVRLSMCHNDVETERSDCYQERVRKFRGNNWYQ